MKQFLSPVSLCVCISITGSSAFAASPKQLQQAELLLAADQADQALGLLEKAHNLQIATTQEFFLLGMSAKLSGNLIKAEQYFRSALSREPGAGRIRLELAEALFRQGKFDNSRSELMTVRRMNPPKQVQQNIDALIAQVDAAKINPNRAAQAPKKNWSAYISTGFTSDSNVNAGPDKGTVSLYGLPFTLSSGAQETQDTGFFFRTGINHQAQLHNGIAWPSSVNISSTHYFESSTYNTTTLNLSSGPTFPLGKRGELSLPITYEVQKYNKQDSWYSQSWGIAPRFQYALQNNQQLYLDTSLSRKQFNSASNRDLTTYTFNPSLNFQPYENSNIAVGLQYGREESGLDIYSNTVRGAYIGYQHLFQDQGIRTDITASYTDIQFDGIQAAYTEARHDVSRKISANVSYLIPQMDGMTLQGSVSYQNNDSNLDINTYDRTQFSLSLTKRF